MAMTVPDVARFTILGRWSSGRKWANVLDYQIDTTGSTLSRNEAIGAQATDVIQNYQSQILPHLTNNVTIEGVRILDLDSETGLSAEAPPDTGEITSGALAGASTTPNVSFLVRKLIAGERGTRSGRMYIPGVQEASVDEDGVLSGTGVTDLQNGLRDFLENTKGSGAPVPVFDYTANLVVVHLEERPPAPLPDNRVGTYSVVQDLALDSMVATQRRRLR